MLQIKSRLSTCTLILLNPENTLANIFTPVTWTDRSHCIFALLMSPCWYYYLYDWYYCIFTFSCNLIYNQSNLLHNIFLPHVIYIDKTDSFNTWTCHLVYLKASRIRYSFYNTYVSLIGIDVLLFPSMPSALKWVSYARILRFNKDHIQSFWQEFVVVRRYPSVERTIYSFSKGICFKVKPKLAMQDGEYSRKWI